MYNMHVSRVCSFRCCWYVWVCVVCEWCPLFAWDSFPGHARQRATLNANECYREGQKAQIQAELNAHPVRIGTTFLEGGQEIGQKELFDPSKSKQARHTSSPFFARNTGTGELVFDKSLHITRSRRLPVNKIGSQFEFPGFWSIGGEKKFEREKVISRKETRESVIKTADSTQASARKRSTDENSTRATCDKTTRKKNIFNTAPRESHFKY